MDMASMNSLRSLSRFFQIKATMAALLNWKKTYKQCELLTQGMRKTQTINNLLMKFPSLAHYIKDLDWVLVGGEQRDDDPPKTRPMQPAWVLDVKTISDGAGVPFFFKQWGGKKAFKSPTGAVVFKAMKHYLAGRTLMEQEWLGWPVPKTGRPR